MQPDIQGKPGDPIDFTLPEFNGPYQDTFGECDHGHPVNGYGRCYPINELAKQRAVDPTVTGRDIDT